MKFYNYLIVFFIILYLCSCNTTKQKRVTGEIALIPKPEKIEVLNGEMILNEDVKIYCSPDNTELKNIAQQFIDKFKKVSGITFSITENRFESNVIEFKLDSALTNLNNEGYNLIINNHKVEISATHPAGVFYGVQTLCQLLPPEIQLENNKNVNWSLPNIKITDNPRFKWRGMHLDVCRHFMPKDFIFKYIDYLAMHKMNTFHWHLTEDQGWRIEIKKYPKLTEISAWRDETLVGHYSDQPHKFDGKKHGGFYTQKDIKEIVKYARNRYITVVPEIEMPGHSVAALAAYPELSCTGGPFEVLKIWGISEEVYCAGKEETFEFLQNVLDEVIELFPSEYIHIGGDECPKKRWTECPDCQKRIKKERLTDEHELQSYFIKRIEKYLNKKGKRIIGWDEILEGGLAPEATVMSWRGAQGGIEAANQGHDVIMSPTSYCYFDYYQGDKKYEPLAIGGYLPLSKVYQFEPVSDEISKEKQKHILGGQANVWTEYMPDEKQVEYMVFPRIAAMAEVLWSKKENRNWNDFMERLPYMLKRYDIKDINYSKSAYQLSFKPFIDTLSRNLFVKINSELPVDTIKYYLKSDKNRSDELIYNQPIKVLKSGTLKAYSENTPKQVFEKQFDIHKGVGAKLEYNTKYSEKYKGNGIYNLIDGVLGSDNYGDGAWQGFYGENMEVEIELIKKEEVKSIAASFMQRTGSWIFLPKKVEYYVSEDGEKYTFIGAKQTNIAKDSTGIIYDKFKIDINKRKVKYLKIKAIAIGTCPQNHQGAGMKAWMFADEIIIK